MCPVCHQLISTQREEGTILISHPLGKVFRIDGVSLARCGSQLPCDILHRRSKNYLFELDGGCSVHRIALCNRLNNIR